MRKTLMRTCLDFVAQGGACCLDVTGVAKAAASEASIIVAGGASVSPPRPDWSEVMMLATGTV
jgi:hypothetical protein